MSGKIDVALLRALIDYRPGSGDLIWKPRPVEMFNDSNGKAAQSCKAWNRKYAGAAALSCKNGSGYRHGAIFGRTVTAHGVAWALHHGSWPTHQIDHINGNPADNRIENLRDVPATVNCHNQSRRRDNTSGVTGVHFNKATGKWVASILGNGKMLNLGYYETIEEAAAVRLAANRRFGFHPNHGRQAA